MLFGALSAEARLFLCSSSQVDVCYTSFFLQEILSLGQIHLSTGIHSRVRTA